MSTHSYDDRVIIPAIQRQLSLFPVDEKSGVYFSAATIDLGIYDFIIVCMSGGKDSIACILRLKELGADMSKVELWHHDIDGREGGQFMDWLFMADYNQKLADALGLPLYFSWLEGGFEGEMLKENSFSRPHKVETPEGLLTLERDTKRGAPGTRLMYPQQSANLASRWCSSALKIDVGRRAINNQQRFDQKKVLFVTGERRQESSNRARYNQLEAHPCDRRAGRKARQVDAWRPVLHLSEEKVWEIICRHDVIAPVPYRLGWGRSSCMTCIFNGPRIWATILEYFPERARQIAEYENRFGKTISRSRVNVIDLASSVRPFEIRDTEALGQAFQRDYSLPVLVRPGDTWEVPAGAFSKEECGAF